MPRLLPARLLQAQGTQTSSDEGLFGTCSRDEDLRTGASLTI